MNMVKGKTSVSNFFDTSNRFRWVLLAALILILTIIVYPNLVITTHQYDLGDVAERDIKAPKDFLIEDEVATQNNRQQAIEHVLTVYDYDADLAASISRKIDQAFTEIRDALATDQKTKNKEVLEGTNSTEATAASSDKKQPPKPQILDKRKHFEEKLGIRVSQGAFNALENKGFSNEIVIPISRIVTKILDNGVVTNKEILLKESDKGITLRNVATKKEQAFQKLKQFYGLDQAKTMVRIVGQPFLMDLDYTILNLVVDFSQRLIQPNITLNRSETEERKKKAATEIKPVLYQVKAREMLLREGERVTDVQLLKLNTLKEQTKQKRLPLSSIGTAILLLCLLVMTYVLHLQHSSSWPGYHNKNLLFLACVSLFFFVIAASAASFSELLLQNSPYPIPIASITYAMPLASGAMLVCLFQGLRIAIPVASVMAICFGIIFQNNFGIFLYFLISNSMASYWIRNCRERKVFIVAGAKLGLLNMVLATAAALFMAEFSGSELLLNWALAFIGGIAAGIVTAGIFPLVEMAFDYTTDITLHELANLDRPILRRLMIEAPGTYHHSVIVGSLVEAAASEIGANPLLAKVCGYYHDIGKLKKPLYFIENQSDGKNRHDKLAPSMSSLILIAHVKDGVEIAQKNKLGLAIIDTIRQHHGSSLIRYFLEKARQLKGEDNVNIDDFRYPGPRPQTRETGLVMLADVIEAASRTLENPTPSRIQGLVQNLINKIFSDGQLDNCELTLKDLHNIARSFNKILYGIYHHRIEYTEKRSAPGENGKGKMKNGGSDRQQARQTQDIPEEDSANNEGHLKRLGLS